MNDYLRHLPMLKVSPKTAMMPRKGNAPFCEADLAAIILAYVPIMW